MSTKISKGPRYNHGGKASTEAPRENGISGTTRWQRISPLAWESAAKHPPKRRDSSKASAKEATTAKHLLVTIA